MFEVWGWEMLEDEVIERETVREALAAAIPAMHRREVQCFILHALLRMDQQDIADRLGVTHSAVAHSFARALEKVRQTTHENFK